MVELYWEVLTSAQGDKCLDIVSLVQKSGRILDIRTHLQEEGFKVEKLTDSEVAVLFFALNDILFMVDDKSSFQYVTLSIAELNTMSRTGYLLPPDEKSSTTNVLKFNSLDVINKYLKEHRFHFIKLVPLEESLEHGTFIAKPTGMRNYPKVLGHKFYSMGCLNNTHAFYARLIGNRSIKINAGGKAYDVKQVPCFAKSSYSCTGMLKFFDLCDNVISLPIWTIEGFTAEPENSVVSALQNGVCKYKNCYVTTNHVILSRYYGLDYVKKLETYSVRCRMALEELYTCWTVDFMPYLQERYGIYEGRTLEGFAHYLQDEIKKGKSSKGNCIIARSLTPIGQIQNGHKSYYVTINLDNIKELEIVEDWHKLMPRKYSFTAISEKYGLKTIQFEDTEANAYVNGRKKFENELSNIVRFVSLYDTAENRVVKGKIQSRLSGSQIPELTKQLKLGYSSNYMNWFQSLCDVLRLYDFEYKDLEPCAKYLFANKLAKRSKAENLNDVIVADQLIELLELMSDEKGLQEALKIAYTDIAYGSAYKLWRYYNENPERLKEAIKSESGVISTDCADFKVDKTGTKLSANVRLKFKGVDLGVKHFKMQEQYKTFK